MGQLDGIKEYQFKKGESGNPNGRPKGRKNFATLFDEAIKSIAEARGDGKTADQIEADLVRAGIMKALKGNYYFYSYIMDRIHGKPLAKTDITSGGEPITKVEVIFKEFGENENNTE